MNLISCNNCGVVLDADNLRFPEDIWDEDGCVDTDLADWDHYTERYKAAVPCPVCKEKVIKP